MVCDERRKLSPVLLEMKMRLKGSHVKVSVTYIGHYISTLYITYMYIRHYISALFNFKLYVYTLS